MGKRTWAQLPSIGYLPASSIKQEVPVPGYVTGGQLMDRLMAIWWGPSAGDPHGSINGEPVEREAPVQRAIVNGQLYECSHLIVSAAEAEEIEGVVSIDGEMRVLSPSDWSERTVPEWAQDLLDGVINRCQTEPTAWANGQLLMFDMTAITAWLNSLSSPHLLPAPLKRDPDKLTNDPVTLSRAVTWLSDGTPMEWWEPISPSQGDAAREIADLKDPDADSFKPSVWLAGYWASRQRQTEAESEVLLALKSGELTAFGEQTSGNSMTPRRDDELYDIPRNYFRNAVKLTPMSKDTIGPDRDADGDSW